MMKRVYTRGNCQWCGQEFGANVIDRHRAKCKIHKAPIERLTRGEAKEAGRMDEWKKALESD
jgi:hypothetical protein